MAKRINKALVAGFWGGVSSVGASFVFTGAPTRDQVSAIIGAFVVGAAVTGYATWKAKPNTPPL